MKVAWIGHGTGGARGAGGTTGAGVTGAAVAADESPTPRAADVPAAWAGSLRSPRGIGLCLDGGGHTCEGAFQFHFEISNQ